MLSNTGYVILGFLANGPHSGYEIKQKVDISTRFFFAASYGQIYPELKKLEEQGLATGQQHQQGQRARVEYSITPAGHAALDEWINEAVTKVEFRDEGLLRLFFADTKSPDQRLHVLKAMRDERAATLTVLKEIECKFVSTPSTKKGLALDFGLGLFEYAVDWCDRQIASLEKSPKE